jgi:hypothetical protein
MRALRADYIRKTTITKKPSSQYSTADQPTRWSAVFLWSEVAIAFLRSCHFSEFVFIPRKM